MTGDDRGTPDRSGSATGRRVRIETDHGDQETARTLARALRPDNTTEMDTSVEDARLVTTVERERVGSLQSTADDYIVNLQTGVRVVTGEGSPADTSREERNHNTDSDGATTSRNTSESETSGTETRGGETDDTETRSAETDDTITDTETDNE